MADPIALAKYGASLFFGPRLMSALVTTGLGGAFFAQAMRYFRLFGADRGFHLSLVAALVCFSIVLVAAQWASIWIHLIREYQKFGGIISIYTADVVQGISLAACSILVKTFFFERSWRLVAKNMIWTVFTAAVMLGSVGGELYATNIVVQAKTKRNLLSRFPELSRAYQASMWLGCFETLWITATLSWVLVKASKQAESADKMNVLLVKHVISISFATAFPVAVVTLIAAILVVCGPVLNIIVITGFSCPLMMIASNSMIYTLNARLDLRLKIHKPCSICGTRTTNSQARRSLAYDFTTLRERQRERERDKDRDIRDILAEFGVSNPKLDRKESHGGSRGDEEETVLNFGMFDGNAQGFAKHQRQRQQILKRRREAFEDEDEGKLGAGGSTDLPFSTNRTAPLVEIDRSISYSHPNQKLTKLQPSYQRNSSPSPIPFDNFTSSSPGANFSPSDDTAFTDNNTPNSSSGTWASIIGKNRRKKKSQPPPFETTEYWPEGNLVQQDHLDAVSSPTRPTTGTTTMTSGTRPTISTRSDRPDPDSSAFIPEDKVSSRSGSSKSRSKFMPTVGAERPSRDVRTRTSDASDAWPSFNPIVTNNNRRRTEYELKSRSRSRSRPRPPPAHPPPPLPFNASSDMNIENHHDEDEKDSDLSEDLNR